MLELQGMAVGAVPKSSEPTYFTNELESLQSLLEKLVYFSPCKGIANDASKFHFLKECDGNPSRNVFKGPELETV